MTSSQNLRTVKVFRYDPEKKDAGHFDTYSLNIEHPEITTILDVLIRLQKEQDSSLSFRFACRVNMCGSCGMVINGREGLACKTNVSDVPAGQDITLRPLNHFPVIKDLVVDMGPFFEKYEDTLPFFEPKEQRDEPYVILPSNKKRIDIGMATDCIACGCCVSSCTMVNNHEGYSGPAALNRAFTLLADERDALFVPRLTRALDSCYNCRTEFNCTEVCPKQISGTRAIKYIQRLAVTHLKDIAPIEAHPAEELPPKPPKEESTASCCCHAKHEEVDPSRRSFLRSTAGLISVGTALALGGVLGVAAVGPTLNDQPKQWVSVGSVDGFAIGSINTVMLKYTRKNAFHKQDVQQPVLVRRDTEKDFVLFSSSCPHLGCSVSWDNVSERFKCACHGGAFDRDGKVLAGPPPRPLDRLQWRVEDNIVKVEVV
ncbi:2Fe-2S iron-sulfur cluster-binding protein [Desulfovibrio litoralis]|uniref:Succinate dehydrogenase / fumarate reductase iron-sulfur subunit n=1 Tax=Desulfovibrio litoralis DSM 11393 TaxID=1121455 RepID=A0A1M7SPK2_9BACT|nr:2Fe-2S iron-sulfur cluster-binding protein [Desulfovibrio litoralis]SHN60346.1 succinate dehydrogenase / fumarate reductase iron-sulfur subunit [Desulfovibrio litoralis DSM 11393]